MVASMPFDRAASVRVASITLIACSACAPMVSPPAPPPEPTPGIIRHERPHPPPNARHVMLGEMCPQAAAGRPAIAPLAMRGVQWIDAPAELGATFERGSVPRLVIYGTDGKLAGVFDTIGVVDIGLPEPVASGAYAGAGPCTYQTSATETGGQLTTRADDAACMAATGGCGIAIGEVTHPEDEGGTPSYTTGGACVSGDTLEVDIDGDGHPESFPLAQLLDGIRGPAQEWPATKDLTTPCTPHYEAYNIKLAPEPEKGRPSDPKAVVMMDVLGVLDLDGDGKMELVLALHFSNVRSIVVYSAIETPQRLELVGEATSFPR
jgi:hypothetical protein